MALPQYKDSGCYLQSTASFVGFLCRSDFGTVLHNYFYLGIRSESFRASVFWALILYHVLMHGFLRSLPLTEGRLRDLPGSVDVGLEDICFPTANPTPHPPR